MNGLTHPSAGAVELSNTEAARAGRPTGQLALSVLTSIFAILAGLALAIDTTSGFFCTTIAQPRGANVGHGGALVLLAGIVGLFAVVGGRNHPRFLSGVLLGETALLGLAASLIARDSATVRTRESCGILTSSVSTSTHHVQYAYVMLGLAGSVLLSQALRGLGRPRHAVRLIAGIAALAVLVAVLPGHDPGQAASLPPHGVLVCRASLGPKPHGNPHCDQKADVGQAPIHSARGLMCTTVLDGVQGKMIGIRAYYEGKLFRHANLRSSDSQTSPYVYFDRRDVQPAGKGALLPGGRYRCTFLVNGEIIRSRTFAVAQARS